MNNRQDKILAAINNLVESGKEEFTGIDIGIQIQQDSQRRFFSLPYSELYRILNNLIDQKVLSFRYHFKDSKKYYRLIKAGVK